MKLLARLATELKFAKDFHLKQCLLAEHPIAGFKASLRAVVDFGRNHDEVESSASTENRRFASIMLFV